MIRPHPWGGAAFTLAVDGDQRERDNRKAVSARLGVSPDWATARQVHGKRVVEAREPGMRSGGADGIFTRVRGLPVAVLTADCAAVVIGGGDGVGVAHAGWRGARAGVVAALRETMLGAGVDLTWAAVGPFIGPCCFEVGPEVVRLFPRQESLTRKETQSVDLGGVVAEQLDGLPTWWSERCTLHQPGSFSHRRDRTSRRMAAVAWIAA